MANSTKNGNTSIALLRVENFLDNHTHQTSCGFWLSLAQLDELKTDLINQNSTGVAFMVGMKDDSNPNVQNKWFSVEIAPLAGNFDNYSGIDLGKDIQFSNQGILNTAIRITHSDLDSNEGQRIPPPQP